MAHTDGDLDVGLAQNLDGGLGDYKKVRELVCVWILFWGKAGIAGLLDPEVIPTA